MPNEPALTIDTAQDLIVNALRDAGIVGDDEQPEPSQLNRAFHHANWQLARWQRHRYLIYRLADYAIPSTGAQTYSVGKGASVNINPRPDRLESAFLRITNAQAPTNLPVDLPLRIISSRENYNQIVVKTLGTLAWQIFYDPVWPVGLLYPWPIPQAGLYEIHATFKETLPRFASLQQKINLPPEYEDAMNWGLVRRFRAAWQLPPDEEINAQSQAALNAIRLANTAVPVLSMPDAVVNRRRAYDYHSDS